MAQAETQAGSAAPTVDHEGQEHHRSGAAHHAATVVGPGRYGNGLRVTSR